MDNWDKNTKNFHSITSYRGIIVQLPGVQQPDAQLCFNSMKFWIIIGALHARSITVWDAGAIFMWEWLANSTRLVIVSIKTIKISWNLFKGLSLSNAPSANIGWKGMRAVQLWLANAGSNFVTIVEGLNVLMVLVQTQEKGYLL